MNNNENYFIINIKITNIIINIGAPITFLQEAV